jgi:CheY-like chemotaxis protein
VTEASDGVEALAASLKQRPDLVVSDIEMPRLDGWELLRLLRTRPSVATVPFVFVTSQEADEVRLRGYRLGVDDFITKTLSDEELVTRAERVLARAVGQPTMTDKRTLRGDLAHMGLSAVLTLMELERMSGVLLIVGSSIARVYLRQGRPLRIEIDESPVHGTADPRIGKLLSWREGQFELAASEPACVDQLDTTVSALLLEQARLADEQTRDDEDEAKKPG